MDIVRILLSSLVPLVVIGGLVFGAATAVRAATGRTGAAQAAGEDEFDAAAAAKSFALNLGLYIAFATCSIGLIDLLQYLVADRRLAGTRSDLARPLALLIVGLPAYTLLLRAIMQRSRTRAAAGDPRPQRGWSVYLFAALTTTLIGVLVSVVQVAHDLTRDAHGAEAEEVMQLVGWFGLWALHWWGLQPRLRIRGDAHLAVGTIIGLGFTLAGLVGVIYRVLADAYDSAFNESLAADFDVAQWAIIAAAGAIVWAWHWIAHFNAAGSGGVGSGGAGSVEGDRRRSPLWFLTVVVAGVLPGLIAMLVSGTTMIGGLLIWFVGTRDEPAALFFEPSPGLLTAFLLGLITWAYHRWELLRGGEPIRNESLRFHDYAVTAVGLVGVVGSIAAVLSLLVQALSPGETIAGDIELDNALILTVTVLIASAAVWWRTWAGIDRHRHARPFDESNSIWRKLYLLAAAGIGGLVLGVSLVWLLFVVLRDTLDGVLGADTFDDLRGPIGWSAAVVGTVWYHAGVFRADRAVLAAHAAASKPATIGTYPPPEPDTQYPPPTGPPLDAVPAVATIEPGLRLRVATSADYGELFTLQRAAFVDEAITYRTPDTPVMNETFDECRQRLATSATLVAVDAGRIVGAVSLRRWRDDVVDVERLMVAPDRRREGIASRLLDEVEANLASQGEPAVQLIVGEIERPARSLYAGRGYEQISRHAGHGGVSLLTVRKSLEAPQPSSASDQ